MTQEQTVKNRLKEVGYVDNFWAIENYILRLGAIMCQLKKQKWEFTKGFGEGKDKKNYFYRLVSEPREEMIDFSSFSPRDWQEIAKTVDNSTTHVNAASINGKMYPIFAAPKEKQKEPNSLF